MKTFGELTREEKLDLITYWIDGGEVEVQMDNGKWVLAINQTWYEGNKYRKALTKPSIDWNCIHPKWKYMARDANGDMYLYESMPKKSGTNLWWDTVEEIMLLEDDLFTFISKGTCDWKDSLVERP